MPRWQEENKRFRFGSFRIQRAGFASRHIKNAPTGSQPLPRECWNVAVCQRMHPDAGKRGIVPSNRNAPQEKA